MLTILSRLVINYITIIQESTKIIYLISIKNTASIIILTLRNGEI